MSKFENGQCVRCINVGEYYPDWPNSPVFKQSGFPEHLISWNQCPRLDAIGIVLHSYNGVHIVKFYGGPYLLMAARGLELGPNTTFTPFEQRVADYCERELCYPK